MARRGLSNDKPPEILEHLNNVFGTPSLQELDQALFRLHDPMDLNKTVEVMIRTDEEVQMLLMAHLYGDL